MPADFGEQRGRWRRAHACPSATAGPRGTVTGASTAYSKNAHSRTPTGGLGRRSRSNAVLCARHRVPSWTSPWGRRRRSCPRR
eukprot:11153380-Lingulodinium_polyedra.AAC.1